MTANDFRTTALKAIPGLKSWQFDEAMAGTVAAGNSKKILSTRQKKKLVRVIKEQTGKGTSISHLDFTHQRIQKATARPPKILKKSSLDKPTLNTRKKPATAGIFSNLFGGQKLNNHQAKNTEQELPEEISSRHFNSIQNKPTWTKQKQSNTDTSKEPDDLQID